MRTNAGRPQHRALPAIRVLLVLLGAVATLLPLSVPARAQDEAVYRAQVNVVPLLAVEPSPQQVQGRVIDANGQGVDGVTVTALREGQVVQTSTAGAGQFRLSLDYGVYQVSLEGLSSQAAFVSLTGRTRVSITFAQSPAGQPAEPAGPNPATAAQPAASPAGPNATPSATVPPSPAVPNRAIPLPSATPAQTVTPTQTSTITPTPTVTPTHTPTRTPTPTPTKTPLPLPPDLTPIARNPVWREIGSVEVNPDTWLRPLWLGLGGGLSLICLGLAFAVIRR